MQAGCAYPRTMVILIRTCARVTSHAYIYAEPPRAGPGLVISQLDRQSRVGQHTTSLKYLKELEIKFIYHASTSLN